MTAAERFWKKVDRAGPDDCWLWTGSIYTDSGYGNFYAGDGRNTVAHRFSFELAAGRPIRDGLRVLHTCDVRRCVNPAHLWEGTQQQNILDMIAKGRGGLQAGSQRGVKNPRAKITEDDVRAIRRRAAAGENQTAIGRDYGLSQGVISKIHRRAIWRHIDFDPQAAAEATKRGDRASRERSQAGG